MALSCYFDFEAKEKSETKVWKLRTSDCTEWTFEEKWVTHKDLSPIWERHIDHPEKICWHQISFHSTKGLRYYAELEFYDKESPETGDKLVKQQDLSSSSVMDIALSEYVHTFPGHEQDSPISVRCNLHLFPLFHSTEVGPSPLPLQPSETSSTSKPTELEKISKKFHLEVKSLSSSGLFSDVLLVCGSTEIKAHKSILSARSSAFAKMFESSTKDEDCRVTISNISADVLAQVLSFVYSGEADLRDPTFVRDLYAAAVMYELFELRDQCAIYLKGLMSVPEQVLENFVLAHVHSDEVMRKIAVDFIIAHYFEMKETEIWISFAKSYPTLAIEILQYLLDARHAPTTP